MNKKGQYFNVPIAIFLLIGVVSAFIMITPELRELTKEPLAAIGDKQAAILEATYKANADRITIRQTAQNSQEQALKTAGEKGFLQKTECGSNDKTNYWNNEEKECYPETKNYFPFLEAEISKRLNTEDKFTINFKNNKIIGTKENPITKTISRSNLGFHDSRTGKIELPVKDSTLTECYNTGIGYLKLKTANKEVRAAKPGKIEINPAAQTIQIIHDEPYTASRRFTYSTTYQPITAKEGIKNGDLVRTGEIIGELQGEELQFGIIDRENENPTNGGRVNPACFIEQLPTIEDGECTEPQKFCEETIPEDYNKEGTIYDSATNLQGLEPTYDEKYNIRTTVYYTASWDDLQKKVWYNGWTQTKVDQLIEDDKARRGNNACTAQWCCIPNSEKGFYEEIKCQGSGVYEGKVYHTDTIKTTVANSKPVEGYNNGITSTGTDAEPGRTIAVNTKEGTECYIPKSSTVCIQFPYETTWSRCYVAEDTGSAFKGKCKIDIYAGVGIDSAVNAAQTGADNKGKGSPRVWVFNEEVKPGEIKTNGGFAGTIELQAGFVIENKFDFEELEEAKQWAKETVRECQDKIPECIEEKTNEQARICELEIKNVGFDPIKNLLEEIKECISREDEDCGCSIKLNELLLEGIKLEYTQEGLKITHEGEEYPLVREKLGLFWSESESFTKDLPIKEFELTKNKELIEVELDITELRRKKFETNELWLHKKNGKNYLVEKGTWRTCIEPQKRENFCYETTKKVRTYEQEEDWHNEIVEPMMIKFGLYLEDTTPPESLEVKEYFKDETTVVFEFEIKEEYRDFKVYESPIQTTTLALAEERSSGWEWFEEGELQCSNSIGNTDCYIQIGEEIEYLRPNSGLVVGNKGYYSAELKQAYLSINPADIVGTYNEEFLGLSLLPQVN